MPCRCSSAITPSMEGGFNPRGGGVQGLASASPMAASKTSFDKCVSGGLLHAATPAARPMSLSYNWLQRYMEAEN